MTVRDEGGRPGRVPVFVGRLRAAIARLRGGRQGTGGPLVPARTTDGASLSPEELDPPPFLAFVDEPRTHDVETPNLVACGFTGWAVSTRERDLTLGVRVDGGQVREYPIDRPRPDVIKALSNDYPVSGERCGFRFVLDLSDAPGDEHTVSLEFSDGEHSVISAPYVVSEGEDRRPPRAAYKEVWNEVSEDLDSAKISVAGYTDEEEFEVVAGHTRRTLERLVGVNDDDVILEIGCGVGRVGKVLAPVCQRWIGTDVSENMLGHAADRLAEFDNVELVATSGWDLKPIESGSIDVVYCTVVFMHLDEWERYNYVLEARRILRPGGRLYIDNFNLLSDQGWEFFLSAKDDHHPLDRPPNISKSSTPEELRTYLERAGFDDVGVDEAGMWVAAHGVKPTD